MGRSQGLDYEAHAILPEGWSVEMEEDGYVLSGPRSADWETAVWGMVRFLSYKPFLALRRTGTGEDVEYELVSSLENGKGFKVTFKGRA
jgi:hypothetical protein